MATPVIICLSVFFLFFAVSKFFTSSEKWARINMYLSLVICGAGAAIGIAAAILTPVRISSIEKAYPGVGNGEWASEVISGFLLDVLPAFGIISALLVLSAAFQPQKLFLRVFVEATSSILVLVFSRITVFLAENNKANVTNEILLIALSLSLIIQGVGFFDFKEVRRRIREDKIKK